MKSLDEELRKGGALVVLSPLEIYVVVRGSARVKVADETSSSDQNTMRNTEAGPEGVEYLALGRARIRGMPRWRPAGGATKG